MPYHSDRVHARLFRVLYFIIVCGSALVSCTIPIRSYQCTFVSYAVLSCRMLSDWYAEVNISYIIRYLRMPYLSDRMHARLFRMLYVIYGCRTSQIVCMHVYFVCCTLLSYVVWLVWRGDYFVHHTLFMDATPQIVCMHVYFVCWTFLFRTPYVIYGCRTSQIVCMHVCFVCCTLLAYVVWLVWRGDYFVHHTLFTDVVPLRSYACTFISYAVRYLRMPYLSDRMHARLFRMLYFIIVCSLIGMQRWLFRTPYVIYGCRTSRIVCMHVYFVCCTFLFGTPHVIYGCRTSQIVCMHVYFVCCTLLAYVVWLVWRGDYFAHHTLFTDDVPLRSYACTFISYAVLYYRM
jgi:hypothetical protein